MIESLLAVHFWGFLVVAPKEQFTVKVYDPIPPVVLKYQKELTQMQKTYHCEAYSQCLNVKATIPPPMVPGDDGYIATCPDGTPAQGSCETPEGIK